MAADRDVGAVRGRQRSRRPRACADRARARTLRPSTSRSASSTIRTGRASGWTSSSRCASAGGSWIYPWNIEPPADDRRRGHRAPRSRPRVRHRHASDDGALPGMARRARSRRQDRDRLRLRLRRARDRRAEARRRARRSASTTIRRRSRRAATTPSATASPIGSRSPRRDEFAEAPPTCSSRTFSPDRSTSSLPLFARCVKPGGALALSGILRGQEAELLERYAEWFDALIVDRARGLDPHRRAAAATDRAKLPGDRVVIAASDEAFCDRLVDRAAIPRLGISAHDPDAAAPMYTQCPECLTIFKLSGADLAATLGSVRCGHCSAIFDALRTLTDQLPPEPIGTLETHPTQVAPPQLGLPVFRPNPAQNQLLFDPDERPRASERPSTPSFTRRRRERKRGATARGSPAASCCCSTLGARDRVGRARALDRRCARARMVDPACAKLGCTLPPRHDAATLELLSRDIRPHPSVPGALIISASVRNDADFAQAFPIVEITLSDLDETRIAMRRFQPREYVSDRAHDRAGTRAGRDDRARVRSRRSRQERGRVRIQVRRVGRASRREARNLARIKRRLLHRASRKPTQVRARAEIVAMRRKNSSSRDLSSAVAALISLPRVHRDVRTGRSRKFEIQRGHLLVNAVSVLRADAAHEPQLQPALRECVARAVRRYLADVESQPREGLHALVLHEVESPLLARSARLVRRQPEQGRGRARHQSRDAAQEAASVRPRRLSVGA